MTGNGHFAERDDPRPSNRTQPWLSSQLSSQHRYTGMFLPLGKEGFDSLKKFFGTERLGQNVVRAESRCRTTRIITLNQIGTDGEELQRRGMSLQVDENV